MVAGGSIKLFEFSGTAVRVHLTFLVLLAWIATIYWMRGGPQAALYGVAFIIILFACVVLHEFGHIFAARQFGIKTPDITLLPIGGVASLERMPEEPGREIIVALAGPLVNLVLAGILFALFPDLISLERLQEMQYAPADLISQVALANIVLFVFNLVPAFPMDGGRVLRALFALTMSYNNATRMAASVGQAIAILFAVLGLMGNPLLILIALFIFLAASGEAHEVESRFLTRGFVARDAMITEFASLSPQDDLDAAARKLLETTQQEFPVVGPGGRLEGVLTREMLINALQKTGPQTRVANAMQAEVESVCETAPLMEIYELLQLKGEPIVAVVDRSGAFVGYINFENFSELVMMRRALEPAGRAAPVKGRPPDPLAGR
jgi:Zn-dependent protease